jgi:hypothetical protein
VDLSDLANLATNYGTASAATWLEGDFDHNGTVDLSDLGDLATNYGDNLTTTGSSQLAVAQSLSLFQADVAANNLVFPAATGVPEPGSLALLVVAVAAGVRPRLSRRRR